MVLGFVGTLIALERAVALGARWALAAPACSAAALPLGAAGAFAWYAAALLWLAGLPIPDLVPWLATIVVVTIRDTRQLRRGTTGQLMCSYGCSIMCL